MKGIKKIMIVVSAIAGLIVLSGCQKELFSRKGEIHNVKFGAKTHSFLGTRTEYGAYNNTDPNLATHQDINWVTGDQIRVYSPTAACRIGLESPDAPKYYWADYSVTPNSDKTTGTITNVGNTSDGAAYNPEAGVSASGNGLAWVSGQEDTKHTFYAIYPSPGTNEVSGNGLAGCSGKFNLSIEGPTQLFTPDARHAAKYMTAVAKPNPASMSDNVELDFYPAFTAFEISLRSADAAVPVESFELKSTGSTALTGNFMVDYTNYSTTTQLPTYTCTGTGKSITVSLRDKTIPAKNDTSSEDLTFCILALPQDLTDLSIVITTAAGKSRTLKLNYSDTNSDPAKRGQPINFTARAKHRIYGLGFKEGSEWMLEIDGEVLPWNGYAHTINDHVSVEEKVKISGAIEPNGYNHYKAANGYNKYYQIRTLNRSLPEGSRYFTMTFTPSAPTGGYWQLIPQYKDGDTESPKHFRFEAVMPGGATSTQLKGPILDSQVTIRIYPKDYEMSDINVYEVWFTCFFSPSISFNPSISADSEFQDVHSDGRFSYWTFRLTQSQEMIPQE